MFFVNYFTLFVNRCYFFVKQTRPGTGPAGNWPGPGPGPIPDWAAPGPGPNGARASACKTKNRAKNPSDNPTYTEFDNESDGIGHGPYNKKRNA